MKAAIILFFYCTFFLAACSQQGSAGDSVPVVRQHTLPVGNSVVLVQQTNSTSPLPYFFVHLHSNETTAAEVAQAFATREGILLIRILNGEERLIRFRNGVKEYRFDPNRIFSATGIRKTLALYNGTDDGLAAVQEFRDTLLQFLDTGKTIIALHNNTNDRFDILHYQETGTGQVHINAEQDPDDFFLTNDAALFDSLKAYKYNVVLEDASKTEEDGSLSLYCSRQNIRYVNVEAEHGHLQEQTAMLNALLRILR